MNEHTPEPWIREGHVIHTHDGTLIADLRRKPSRSFFECHIGNMHLTMEEVTANGDLIAAAPDLLAACEAIITAEGCADVHGLNHPETINWLEQAYELAVAAIAKAHREVNGE